ncbi:MAG: lysophospholipid acyltransferase family protein [Dehalococcoidia bacterium]
MVWLATLLPLTRTLYRLDIEGLDYLDEAEPAIFAANHASHLDNALILVALPDARRRRIAVAAAADTIFKRRGQGYLAALLGNAFPVARGGGSRRTVEYVRWLADKGWSVLLYPEGRLTVGGPMGQFRHGIGLMAVETGRPVVPVRLDVLRRGVGEERRLPWRGQVRVRFGPPCRFPPQTDVADAVARVQRAVEALADAQVSGTPEVTE